MSNNTLTYYLTMALEKAGVEVNGDMRTEMDDITQDFEARLEVLSKRITALESPKPAANTKKPAAQNAAPTSWGPQDAFMQKAAGWWAQYSPTKMRFATHVQLAAAIRAFEDVDDDGGKFEDEQWTLKSIATEEEWSTITQIVDAMSEAVTKYPKGLNLLRDYASLPDYIMISHRAVGFYVLVSRTSGSVKLCGNTELFFTGAIEAAADVMKEAARISATIMAKATK